MEVLNKQVFKKHPCLPWFLSAKKGLTIIYQGLQFFYKLALQVLILLGLPKFTQA